MEDQIANVTIKIVSEQVNVTRDEDGEVVDGDADHISEVTDIWTYARDTKTDDPNWLLVATRSLD
jgi:predicted lipid-binding transport protein (Tim44 family)